MKISDDQIKAFREDGYFFIEDLIPTEEIDAVRNELPELMSEKRRELIFENDGATPRSLLNAHLFNEPLDRLCRDHRLIEPSMMLVDSPVYIFQSIVNLKRAFTGDQWQWHQDYPTYRVDDDMLENRGVNVMVFLEDVNALNGPLMMIPGTQTMHYETPEIDNTTTSYPGRYSEVSWIRDVMAEKGIACPKGRRGSTIFLDFNIVHGSAQNMSPWDRSILSLTVSSVENKATGTRRGFAVLHDYSPVEPLHDGLMAKAS